VIGKTRTKIWENTIGSALSASPHFFESGAETLGQAGYWTLRNPTDPPLFKEPKEKGSQSGEEEMFSGLRKGINVSDEVLCFFF
jgi:hypothetical protein